ncbi:peptidoglycan editing factor PgeF [Bacillus sp. PS06]|uniref:peptidoglycan editing factor PgeF n=1 Tax=Bacillus sp. PS06 TaxID=2764176 RepID=UPI00177E8329|nr:peptidoglycan editing factor PgeF [Bacillus sp. PS06]MBD8068377.1 peptidoglycan editing factor PgeF [Bacillus sp. PS06]
MQSDPYKSSSRNTFLQLNDFNSLSNDDTIIAGFSTKNGGFSKDGFSTLNLGFHVFDDEELVKQNRRLLGEHLGIQADKWVGCEQVHEAAVVKVTKEMCGRGALNYKDAIPRTDAIYTTEKDLLLTLCYADCVPLYFYDPTSGMIGIAHAGWKGTVNDIAGEMVRTWVQNEGVNPHNIYASIGPAIDQCCYIVDDAVINAIKDLEINHTGVFKEVRTGQYQLNLKYLNELLMIEAGIPKEQISVSSYCTSCETGLFFSHRRDKGKTGRMLSYIGRKEV